MKRSEFKSRLAESLGDPLAAARLAEEAGVQWEPEEVEFPEELEVRQNGDGTFYLHPKGVRFVATNDMLREIAFAAVSRWRRLPELEALARELANLSDADIRCLVLVFRLRDYARSLGFVTQEAPHAD